MARARTGTLLLKPSGKFFAQIHLTLPDGTRTRRAIPLHTTDRTMASRMLGQIVGEVEAGTLLVEPKSGEGTPTFEVYAEAWLANRRTIGVVMAADEERHIELARSHIGTRKLTKVRAADIRAILSACQGRSYSKETIRKVRGTLHRIFQTAWKAEIVTENPVGRVDVPSDASEDLRPRTVLTDSEFIQFMQHGKDVELKMAAVCARLLGGMRSSEIYRWDWSLIDTQHFQTARIPRSKQKRGRVGVTQELFIPDELRPYLTRWWTLQGSPSHGPVFPAQKGERKGGNKHVHNTMAKRLRQDLWRAGISRHQCLGCERNKPCANFANDPIYNDLPTSKRVDFHSFRRAFATSLAEGGVNAQTSMRLSAHSDDKVHALYVSNTRAMKTIPQVAIPAGLLATNGCDSISTRPKSPINPARHSRLERLTYGFGGRRSIQLS